MLLDPAMLGTFKAIYGSGVSMIQEWDLVIWQDKHFSSLYSFLGSEFWNLNC